QPAGTAAGSPLLSSPTAIYSGSASGGHSYRTRNARAAEAAIAVRVLAEVLLVVVLGVVELGRRADFGRDRAVVLLVQRLLERFLRFARGLELLITICIDG